MYTIFVYVIFATFQKHGVNNNVGVVNNDVGSFGFFRKKTDSSSSSSSGANNNSNRLKEEIVATSSSEEKQKPNKSINKNMNMNIDEIQSLLSGSLIRNLDVQSIPVEVPSIVGDNQKEGLGDIRPAMTVIKETLNAARFGDRVYESDVAPHKTKDHGKENGVPTLTAYIEPINQTEWKIQPLPVRQTTHDQLHKVSYPHVNSCSAFTSQFPIDNPPVDLDPFLPWIHDVFPSSNGKYVMFVAQNRRRCYNGQKMFKTTDVIPEGVIPHKGYVHVDPGKNYYMRPQAALFQHVPVKRIDTDDNIVSGGDNSENEILEPRYRLASHEEADPIGMETRFICRFKLYDATSSTTSIIGYSLSEYELDYDYHTFRKGYRYTHTENGYDNHVIWTSQLLFKCPIPTEYHDTVSRGDHVKDNDDDYTTMFVDVVPIRTAPRYMPPREFLPPRYNHKDVSGDFLPDAV